MTNRTHRSLLVAAVCVFALAVPAQAQDTDNQFTGSWFHYVQGAPNLVTIHPDGTLTVTSAWLFGGGGAPIRVSPVHAAWEKVGPGRVSVTSFFFLFDAEGNIAALQRNTCLLRLGADRATYTGTEVMERAYCSGDSVFGCPNPFDADTVWTPVPGMPPSGYPVMAYRIKAVPYEK
jgi:hypothetical protein